MKLKNKRACPQWKVAQAHELNRVQTQNYYNTRMRKSQIGAGSIPLQDIDFPFTELTDRERGLFCEREC